MASVIKVNIKVRKRLFAPLYWAIGYAAVWLLIVDGDVAAKWVCDKSYRFEVA